jgi:hypothetical protein
VQKSGSSVFEIAISIDRNRRLRCVAPVIDLGVHGRLYALVLPAPNVQANGVATPLTLVNGFLLRDLVTCGLNYGPCPSERKASDAGRKWPTDVDVLSAVTRIDVPPEAMRPNFALSTDQTLHPENLIYAEAITLSEQLGLPLKYVGCSLTRTTDSVDTAPPNEQWWDEAGKDGPGDSPIRSRFAYIKG